MAQELLKPTQLNALYDQGDVARGVFLETFYGSSWSEGQNVSGQILSNAITYSDPIVMKHAEGEIATAKELFSKNFDLGFGLPRIINGVMIINVPMGAGDNQAGGGGELFLVSGQITDSNIEIHPVFGRPRFLRNGRPSKFPSRNSYFVVVWRKK